MLLKGIIRLVFLGPMAEFTLPIIGIGADVAALYSQTDLGADGEKNNEVKDICSSCEFEMVPLALVACWVLILLQVPV